MSQINEDFAKYDAVQTRLENHMAKLGVDVQFSDQGVKLRWKTVHLPETVVEGLDLLGAVTKAFAVGVAARRLWFGSPEIQSECQRLRVAVACGWDGQRGEPYFDATAAEHIREHGCRRGVTLMGAIGTLLKTWPRTEEERLKTWPRTEEERLRSILTTPLADDLCRELFMTKGPQRVIIEVQEEPGKAPTWQAVCFDPQLYSKPHATRGDALRELADLLDAWEAQNP